ncbi:helix-turn-helix domain-containing protein [Flavobacterium urocaniciphilum]|uniref:Helix-turn-helix n=1 Tax=Flavobacterium urocaniciphilum TaxID=1299341 RepID=A0A1H8ZA58_9FLAO|nr:helix-turn-helix transcriptional regulator [Flavobacterium urocaniciphilum]SEP61320.1 Helix-turn-helix [Flavobacterium urocaniciphilum]
MLNIDEFVKRLEIIFDYYGLTASSFADKINVQRSSISHLLSGRNKPSLDFIMKLIETFPEVDLIWILNGTGKFPKSENPIQTISSTEIKLETEEKIADSNENSFTNLQADLFSTPIHEKIEIEKNRVNENDFKNFSNTEVLTTTNFDTNSDQLEIEKIVIFYTNGTFSSYKQKNPNSK